MKSTDLFVWGFVLHLIVDWLFQNQWMADNKSSLHHPASWVHSGIHLIGLLLVFPAPIALIIATTHLLIDTRVPLQWWRKTFRQTTEGPMAVHVAIWTDQVAHVAVLAIAAFMVGRGV